MEETQQRRFWLIEFIAYWEGRLTTTHLREFFGISRQQASADISASGPPLPAGLAEILSS